MAAALSLAALHRVALRAVPVVAARPAQHSVADWNFPIGYGVTGLKQTSGALALGAFSGFNATRAADLAAAGVVATGHAWGVNALGVGIILETSVGSPKSAQP